MPGRIRFICAATALALAACSGPDTQSAFFDTLKEYCGQTVSGQVVSQQVVDADWRAQTLTLGPIDCSGDALTPDMPEVFGDSFVMPLAVGDDTSRVWLLFETDDNIEFRHFHYEPDGSPSPVTSYGGVARGDGTERVQNFPADAATKANFRANDIARSVPNVWTFSLDDDTLTYQLARPATGTDPARDFRAVFDLPPKS